MLKLLFLVLILEQYISCDTSVNEGWVRDLKEFDDILFEQDFELNLNSSLPKTPQAIYDKWCKPLLSNSLEMISFVDKVFPNNPAMHIVFRLFETNRINGTLKFCNDHSEVKKWARLNREIVSIWPTILEWYKIALNANLAIADPQSNISYPEFVCIQRLLRERILAETPTKLQEAVDSYFSYVNGFNNNLFQQFLNHLKHDFNLKGCKLPNSTAQNHFGIKSIKLATLYAGNKTLKGSF